MSHKRKALTIQWAKPKLNLYFIGDTHILAEVADEDKQTKLAELIASDKDAGIVGLGDYIEAIAFDDYRFDPSELVKPIVPEYLSNPMYSGALRFAKIWEPTKGKWLAMISGNHEGTATHRYHVDSVQLIADRLGGVPYVGGSDHSGWLRIQMREAEKSRGTLHVYLIHGWGGGELRGADALKMQRLLGRKRAHLIVMAHVHRPNVFPEPFEYIDGAGWERTETRWGLINFPMVAKHGYLARKGANSPSPGYALVEIERRREKIPKISVSLKEL
jgi:hypothetical protein